MKKTNKDNLLISDVIADSLGITFNNEEFSLGKWGEVDNWCELGHDTIILLECEKGQKHPNTNVLKLFPYLEQFPLVHVILIHYFFPENKAPKNRIDLCKFISEKIRENFGPRFQYIYLNCKVDLISNELTKDPDLIKFLPSKKLRMGNII